MYIESDDGFNLITDPWIIGSCYWRSWWNFPEPSKALVKMLNPDAIYLTHIHWDHFHSVSLKNFSKKTKIIVPIGNFTRMKRDLNKLGFRNVVEINHNSSIQLSNKLKITSYQFSPFFDSALVAEDNQTTLLNLNDSKFLGPPLKQILNNHRRITFVFRSHSNANSEKSYNIINKEEKYVTQKDKHLDMFYYTVRETKAKYVVPFASNHCLLHKENFHLNDTINTPLECLDYFNRKRVKTQTLQVMISGDSWSKEKGFQIGNHDPLHNRQDYLNAYVKRKNKTLLSFYKQEDKANVKFSAVDRYFKKFIKKIPFIFRIYFKNVDILYVLMKKGVVSRIISVNLFSKKLSEKKLSTNITNYSLYPIQVHTTEFIFQRCIAFGIFSHLTISKRLKLMVSKEIYNKMKAYNYLINMVEYELLPLRNNLKVRSLKTWLLRWREILLYANLSASYIFSGKVDLKKYFSNE
tara:strand:+ start:15068 stop:16462 length:1395 start_codon:yes stop_codon:yes gene_type:complete